MNDEQILALVSNYSVAEIDNITRKIGSLREGK